jgi:hypothetical protein
MELWNDVAGFEGLYQVSDEGRVQSLVRVTPTEQLLGTRRHKAYLTPQKNPSGHYQVTLSRAGASSRALVHMMVARAFLGPGLPGEEVVFADGDFANMRRSNLSWRSRKAHFEQKVKTGTRRRAANGQSGLTEYDVRQIRSSKLANRQLALLFGVSNVSIHNIKTGKTWGHIN